MPTPASAWPWTSDAAIVAMPISAQQHEGRRRADEAVDAVRGIDRAEQREGAGCGQDARHIGVGDAFDRHLEAGAADELAGRDQRDTEDGGEDQPQFGAENAGLDRVADEERCRRAPAPGRRPRPPSACRARSRWSGRAGLAAAAAAGAASPASTARQVRPLGQRCGFRAAVRRRRRRRPAAISAAEFGQGRHGFGAGAAVAPAHAWAPAVGTAAFSRCARNAVRNPSRSNSSTRRRCCCRHDDDDQRHDRDEANQFPKHRLPLSLGGLCLLSGPNSRRDRAQRTGPWRLSRARRLCADVLTSPDRLRSCGGLSISRAGSANALRKAARKLARASGSRSRAARRHGASGRSR